MSRVGASRRRDASRRGDSDSSGGAPEERVWARNADDHSGTLGKVEKNVRQARRGDLARPRGLPSTPTPVPAKPSELLIVVSRSHATPLILAEVRDARFRREREHSGVSVRSRSIRNRDTSSLRKGAPIPRAGREKPERVSRPRSPPLRHFDGTPASRDSGNSDDLRKDEVTRSRVCARS